jgi:hypothetical protein
VTEATENRKTRTLRRAGDLVADAERAALAAFDENSHR